MELLQDGVDHITRRFADDGLHLRTRAGFNRGNDSGGIRLTASGYGAKAVSIRREKTRARADGVKCDLQLAIDKCAVKAGNHGVDPARIFGQFEAGLSQFGAQRRFADDEQARVGQMVLEKIHHDER